MVATTSRCQRSKFATLSIVARSVSRNSGFRSRSKLRRDSDLGVVQHMLGHEDIHTTETYYGHYDLSDLELAMEQFATRRSNDPK